MLGANFLIKALAWIFIAALDKVAYFLLAAAYTIFLAVSQLDIFSTEAGGTIYNEICARFYSALSIIMIFVFAYFLIMMIVDPDGGQKKASTQLVKDVVLSIVLVIVLPTIFGYMSLFQKHVLTNNTIGALIIGGNGTIADNPGKQISMIVFTAFFHPQGTMYSDYFGNDGKMIDHDAALSVCKGPHDIGNKDSSGNTVEVSTDDDVCEAWVEGLESWENSTGWGIDAISGRAKLRDTVGDEGGMEYLWILSTAAAVAVAYFFFSYTLDVGTRAVKLGFLQLIAPVPVMLKMFPQTKKTFDTWFAEIKKCYLDIFIRLAVIFFIVKLCTMVPAFLSAIFGSTSTVEGNFLIKAIATVCLILGLLKFAKEAPGLMKTIFSSSTGLFAGIDFKPGVKRRISENEYAMKGMSTVTGAVGGAIGTGVMAYRNYLKKSDVQGNGDDRAKFGAALHTVLSIPRGIVSGGRRGFENTPQEFGLKNMGGTFNQGASGGQASYIHHDNSKVFDVVKAKKAAEANGTSLAHELKEQGIERGWEPKKEAVTDAVKSEYAVLIGESANSQAAVTTINTATSTIDNIINLTSSTTKPYDEAYEGLRKKILSGEEVTYNGKVYTTTGGGYSQKAYEEDCKKAGKAMVDPTDPNKKYNPVTGRYEVGYNPATAAKYQTASLKDLEKIFTDQKNAKAAETLKDKYREGTATYAATLREQLSKEIGNLGSDTVAKLTAEIRSKTGDQSATLDSFLKDLSDKNSPVTADKVAALKSVKSTLDQRSKNISIQAQLQQQAKQNGAGSNKPPKDK